MSKVDWLFIFAFVTAGMLVGYGLSPVLSRFGSDHGSSKTYTVECAVITPSGPVGTISAKELKDVVITDFGIIKHSRGLYVPNTNEICFVKEVKE